MDPARQIELDDLVMIETRRVAEQLRDTGRFPLTAEAMAGDGNHVAAVEYVLERVEEYWELVSPLAHALTVGCAFGQPNHDLLWSRVMTTIANTGLYLLDGRTVLIHLRRYPVLPLLMPPRQVR